MVINRLYSHQGEAINHIRQGRHVIVSTPTASGKSMVYNLTVLEGLIENRRSKALYLFPLKALEQDQLKTLSMFIRGLKGININAGIYDGDTSPYMRKKLRANIPEILFTNPDMLHQGIMAYHENWKVLFENQCFFP